MERVLTIENLRHGLAAVRSLGAAGHWTVVGYPRANADAPFTAATLASKYCSDSWSHAPLYDPDAFLSELVDYVQKQQISVVLPIYENGLRLLLENQHLLPRGCRVAAPPARVVDVCLDKGRSAELAHRVGFDVPDTEVVRDRTALDRAIESIGLPVVLKPLDSSQELGRKALKVHSAEEVDAWFEVWPRDLAELVVQSLRRGLRHNCMFYAEGGRILQYFESRVERTNAWSGVGVSTDSVSIAPTLRSECEAWCEELDYEGVGCLQFLVDGDRKSFLECNPRLDATCELPRRCGVDFPRLAVEGRIAIESDSYVVGRRHACLISDLVGLREARDAGEIGWLESGQWLSRCAISTLRSRIHTVWTLDDPFPSLAAVPTILRALYTRLFGPFRPSRVPGLGTETTATGPTSAENRAADESVR